MHVISENENSYTVECDKCFNLIEVSKSKCKKNRNGKKIHSYVICKCGYYEEDIDYCKDSNIEDGQTICGKCGKILTNDSDFCSQCGKKIKRKIYEKRIKNIKTGIVAFGVLFILIGIIIYVNAFNNHKLKLYEKEYVSKVQALVLEYNLKDANIVFEYSEKHEKYRKYKLAVESSNFVSLENLKKFNFITSLHGIYIEDANFLVLEDVISNGDKYDIDVLDNSVLTRNGSKFYSNSLAQINDKRTSGLSNTMPYEKEPSDDDKSYAWVAAVKEVKSRLKAPSTAKFPFNSNGQNIKEVDYKTFVINSYVDAENSFGAKIRSNFMVKIKRTGENTYNLLDVQIFE